MVLSWARINAFSSQSCAFLHSKVVATQTSASFPKNNNWMSHEPTTQPLPPAAAHRSLQQLWLPLRQQQLHKMSQRNISPRGKLEIKPKPHLCVHNPCHFFVMMEIKASSGDYFTPLTFSVIRASAGQLQLSQNHCLAKSNSRNATENILILWNTKHFTSAVASEPYSIFVLTMLLPFFGVTNYFRQPEWFFGHKSGSTCWEGINIFVWLH